MGNGTESETMVVNQAPAVAQETGDSRAPPIRVLNHGESSNPVVINNKEYPLSSSPENPAPTIDSRHRALGEQNQEFCDWNLPLPRSGDTTALSEAEHPHALNAIASSSEPVALDYGEDLPNQVANPEKIRLEEKERSLDRVQKELHDPTVLDVVCRLINLRHVDFSFRKLAAKPLGKQCEGGKGGGGGSGSTSKGSQTESNASQGSQHGTFVTGYTGSSLGNHIVTGLGRGCGGGGGGGDDDPFNYRPPDTLSGHYADFVGFEEQPNNDAQRDAAMAILTTMADNPMLPQFNQNREELPSCNLEMVEAMDFDGDDSLFDELLDSALQIEPTEETLVSSLSPNPPVSEETQSDIGHAFDLIHLMKPVQRSKLQGPMVGLAPVVKSIPHSQIPGNNTTAYLPLPSPSPATPYSAPTPSPMQPASIPPTPTSLTPSPMPPTPSTPQPCGFFKPNSFIEGDNRVCELTIPPHIPQEKRNTPLMALYYTTSEYQKIMQCVKQSCDLKVASDVMAKMCAFEFHPEECRIAFTMPKECKPLSQWLSPAVELKDRLLILQQVINTLATIHTLGHEEQLSLWGSFMVWVAADMRVHLLVDFPLLFQKQQEYACSVQQPNPRRCDVLEVQKIYEKLIAPYVGQNESWVSPGLSSVLHSFQCVISDVSSSCRMAEAARTLGERRMCRIDVEMMNLPIVIYCMERESLLSALQPLVPMVPRSIAHVWEVRSLHPRGPSTMRAGDVATADRRMQLSLVPCMFPSDPRALYIDISDTT